MCKFFEKNLQIFLFFQLERERTDEISLAEEVNRVESRHHLIHRAVARTVEHFAGIFDLLFDGVGDLVALEGEHMRFALFQQVACGINDACVEVLDARRAGNILRNGEIELQFADMAFAISTDCI